MKTQVFLEGIALAAFRKVGFMFSDPTMFSIDKVQFVMLSFEGPDLFSMAGGLGIRAQELCNCLASMGFTTHLYFIGDPDLPAEEQQGKLILHRWCQWISAANPGGCYVAEDTKVKDYGDSIPSALVEKVIAPAAYHYRAGRRVANDSSCDQFEEGSQRALLRRSCRYTLEC